MAFSRALGVISIISVSWFATVGCGDDDSNSQPPGGAGEGGEAGETSGGTSAGGTNNGGTNNGGTSSAGDAGNGTGGTAGDAGAGVGGQPVLGGAGGEPAVVGAAGASGAGGEPPIARAAQCGNSCEQDDDCFINELNPTACDLETKRCYPTEERCVTDTSCIPAATGWLGCEGDNDCADDDSERCVAVDGKGYCALLPGPEGCDDFSEATELPVFGGGAATATVCASVWRRCNSAGSCYIGCDDPLFGGEGCGQGNGDTCNEVTGLCDCATGDECETNGVCGADHQCAECSTDQDCIDKNAVGLDKCIAGKCGCAAASSCPDSTESATPVCE